MANGTAHTTRSAVAAGVLAAAALVGTHPVTAESSQGAIRLPDALVFEVLIAPGYSWMEVLHSEKDITVARSAENRDPPETADEADHASHHPASEPSAVATPEPERYKALRAELLAAMNAFEALLPPNDRSTPIR